MPQLSPRRWIVAAALFVCSFAGSAAVAESVIDMDVHPSTTRLEEWALLAQSLIVSPVPEPASLLLFGVGLFLAARHLRNTPPAN